jgi:hypothetical protein
MPSDPERERIDAITERVTVDAYGDEGHTSFLCAFEDEVDYPIAATLAGTPVTRPSPTSTTMANRHAGSSPSSPTTRANIGSHSSNWSSKAGFRADSSTPTVAGSASIRSH